METHCSNVVRMREPTNVQDVAGVGDVGHALRGVHHLLVSNSPLCTVLYP